MDIKLKVPHSIQQREMIVYPGNVCTFAGRRFGKTDGYVQRLYYWMQRSPGLYWWVGLSWKSASLKRAWRKVSAIARVVLRGMELDDRAYINRSNYEIRIPGLGEIWFRTADNPSSLAGEGIRGAVVDEFTLMDEIVWTEFLQATLLDYHGWAAFGGVPKGLNWGGLLWTACKDWDGWKQITATTYDNPFISRTDIDAIKAIADDRLFRQEYLAELIPDGAYFQNIDNAAVIEEPDQPDQHQGHYIVMGVDWGLKDDYTVMTVACQDCNKVVDWERLNKIDYIYQRERLMTMAKRWDPYILPERNSIGVPNIEILAQDGLSILHGPDDEPGFNTSATTKPPLIQGLASGLEHDGFLVPKDYADELRSYEVETMASGHPKFGAPSGQHDDRVISLALARWAMTNMSRAIF